MEAAPPTRLRLGFVALFALLYGGAHLTWYWGTPLGCSPVLDERENLQLAAQIANGDLPPEPFYRAAGYPLFLSGLRAAGIPLDSTLPQAATAAGLLLHVLNTWMVAVLARRWFGSERAGWIAGLLHGFNPVLIHYSTQVLDAVPANTLVLAGLLCLPREKPAASGKQATLLSLAWAGAALVRPQLLPLWLAFPVIWLAATPGIRRQGPLLLTAIAAGGLLWLAQGLWSLAHSGQFRLLPWQGAYNLWAANHPGANGRYYTQQALIAVGDAHENPARLESVAAYRAAAGDTGPLRIDALNAYWRERLRREIAASPGRTFALMLRKAVYLAGNFEQYNNKTYSFHQARSPWLRWNPLGWGMLLLTGVLGLVALGRAARPWLVAAGAIAAGILVAYTSARFRLPLVALLCVFAGGALASPRAWWPATTTPRAALAGLLLALGVLAYGGWFNGHDRSTYLQDHLLLGLAAQRTGRDDMAWIEARAALRLNPAHRDALHLGLTSYFNLLLQDRANPAEEREWHEIARQSSPEQHAALIGLALWRAGDSTAAELWRRHPSNALAALVLSGEATDEERKLTRGNPRSLAGPDPFAPLLAAREAPDGDLTLKAAADRLFRKPPL